MTAALHLHAVQHVDRPVDEVVDRLRRDAHTIAGDATRAAFAATADHRAGLADIAPRVDTRHLDDGMAVIIVSWNDDAGRWPPAGRFPFATDPTSPWWHREEEQTGWPTMTLQIVLTPSETGTRLAVMSSRTPGVDVTTNRIDRHRRDRLARAAVDEFLSALAGLLAPTPEPVPA